MITIAKKDGTVTEITPSSANTEGVAAPSTETGVNGQESAEPAANDTADADTSDTNGEASGKVPASGTGEGDSIVQDAKTNAKFAAARRAAEKQRDEAIASVKAEVDKAVKAKIESFIAGMKLRTPDGKVITTEEEYGAFMEAKEKAESTANAAEQAGITPDKVNELVSAHPDVAAAKEAKEQISQMQNAIASERAQKAIDEQVAKVRESFPEVNSLDDIVSLERYPDIKAKISQGYSMADAVKLAYEDVYIKRRTAAAAQQAKNAINSTAHLSATKTHGSGGVNVTEQQIKSFIAMIPGSTRADAIKAYQKYKVTKG